MLIDFIFPLFIGSRAVNNVTMDIMNVHFTGGSGIAVSGYNNTLVGVAVTRTGCGGIHLSGGDQVH